MSNLKYLTVTQVAEMLDVAPTTVTRHVRKGRVEGAIKLNPRMWLIPKTSLNNFDIHYEKIRNDYKNK